MAQAPAGAGTGTWLSYAQLKAVWLAASKGTKYHTNWWASLMAAIGMAESKGDATVTNPTDNGGTQTSWGVWQISNGTHSAPASNWADPYANARLAIGKLDSQGLSAWGTYDSGAYKAFLSSKTSPDATGIDVVSSAVGKGLTGQIESSSDCLYGPNVPLAGQICLLTYGQARALIGGGLLVAGVVTVAFGGSLMVKAAGITMLAGPAAKILGGVSKAPVAGGAAGAASSATAAGGTTAADVALVA